ncbi:MAG: Flp pilus assembly protein CpaB, partial [Selenomonadaceae bacterium]|nr:Flp pilus assembly protein CpaB [Selenomonadaceae bacterium]
MFSKFFDWLSGLRPKQLLALAGGAAIFMFILMYAVFYFLIKPTLTPVDNGENTTAEEKKEEEIKMISVVVAARNIEPKTMLISRLLETQEFPENTLPPDAVTDIAEIANKPARDRIFKGDIITYSKVYRNAAQAGFVGSIPPDCRAVSIHVNEVTGVAGFAKPGDYVDLILVEKDDNSVTSRLLLQNVL